MYRSILGAAVALFFLAGPAGAVVLVGEQTLTGKQLLEESQNTGSDVSVFSNPSIVGNSIQFSNNRGFRDFLFTWDLLDAGSYSNVTANLTLDVTQIFGGSTSNDSDYWFGFVSGNKWVGTFIADTGPSSSVDILVGANGTVDSTGFASNGNAVDPFRDNLGSVAQRTSPKTVSFDFSDPSLVTFSGNAGLAAFSGSTGTGLDLSQGLSLVLIGDHGTEDYRLNSVTIEVVSAVPVPAALPLLLGAIAGLGAMGWRKRRIA